MSLLQLDEAVLAQLQAASLGITVESFPERPSEYSLLDPVGAALVVISSSRFSTTANQVGQERRTRVVITLLMRNLRTHTGAYGLMDAVLDALLGWMPSEGGWQPLIAISDQFVSEESGVWQYDMVFESSRYVMSQFNPCLPF